LFVKEEQPLTSLLTPLVSVQLSVQCLSVAETYRYI